MIRTQSTCWVVFLGAAFAVSALLPGSSIGAPAGAKGPTPEQALTDIDTELGNQESRLGQLHAEYVSPVAETPAITLERRLIDAHVLFEQGMYAKASVLLTDILENERFARSRDSGSAAHLLGRALFLDRNFQASERAFRRLITPAHPKYYQDALAHLVEIALHSHDGEKLSRYYERIVTIPPALRSPDTLYVMGKALFQEGDYAKAKQALDKIPIGTDRYFQALYYQGAIQVALGNSKVALIAFQDIVVASDGGTEIDRNLVELAHIALGRLYADEGRGGPAVDQYQSVTHFSVNYETALFEMAWAYVNAGAYQRAANTLDILILNVQDEQIEVEAHVLRGRLSVLLEDFDGASQAYERVVDRFDRIRAEITDFRADRVAVRDFFRWLLRRDDETFAMGRPVSGRLVRWVGAGQEMQDIQRLLDDLARTRRDLVESEQMARTLRGAVDSPNRVELFENLRNGWTRALEMENLLVDANRRMLNEAARLIGSESCGEGGERIEEVRARRTQLEARFRLIPKTAVEYTRRQSRVHRAFEDLKKQVFLVETSLRLLRKQVQAVESWLRSEAYDKRESTGLDARDRAMIRRVREESVHIEALKSELDDVLAQIALEEGAVGAGDATDSSEGALRQELTDLQREELRLLVACAEGAGGRTAKGIQWVEALQGRVWKALRSVARVTERIASTADRKADETRALVAAEERDLARFREDLERAEQQALGFAHELGEAVFRDSEERIADIILEADVGLVELTWQRQKSLDGKLRELRQQKSEETLRIKDIRSRIFGPEDRMGGDE